MNTDGKFIIFVNRSGCYKYDGMTTKLLSFPVRREPRHHPIVLVFGALLLLGLALWGWFIVWLWRTL
jgi:hypothetical protein